MQPPCAPLDRECFCEPCLERRLGSWSGKRAWSGCKCGLRHRARLARMRFYRRLASNRWLSLSATAASAAGSSGVLGRRTTRVFLRHGWPGLLGFIPGVGAMYNGQFAKGVVHLIVFAVLVSLSDHVSGVFGLVRCGLGLLYGIRGLPHRAGTPDGSSTLPDPFGWNNIGERLGFNKGWPGGFATGGTVPTPPGNASMASATTTARSTARYGLGWVCAADKFWLEHPARTCRRCR